MTWRRSAVSCVFGSAWTARLRRCEGCACELADGREHYPPMPEQDAKIFEVLIGQMRECRKINVVFGKALCVLGHAERFEPVRNLLHRGPHPHLYRRQRSLAHPPRDCRALASLLQCGN